MDTPHKTPKTIRTPGIQTRVNSGTNWGDKLNYYNVFRVESKDDLEVMAAMLDTTIRDSFASSCTEKIIQDKSMWWTKELNKHRKNTRWKQRDGTLGIISRGPASVQQGGKTGQN